MIVLCDDVKGLCNKICEIWHIAIGLMSQIRRYKSNDIYLLRFDCFEKKHLIFKHKTSCTTCDVISGFVFIGLI